MTDLHDLPTWLRSRRWFGSKDRVLDAVEAIDTVALPASQLLWLTVIEAAYATGPADRWLLVLTPAGNRTPLGQVDGVDVVDIVDAPQAVTSLIEAMAALGKSADDDLPVTVGSHGKLPALAGEVRSMGVEQSNTSFIVDDEVVVKLVRRLEAGPNPEIELTGALTRAGVDGVPPLLAAMTGPADEALVTISQYVPDTAGGWEASVAEATAGGTALAEAMADLGALTAAIHRHLAVLGTQEADPEDTAAWRSALAAQAQATAESLDDPRDAEMVRQAVQTVLPATDTALGTLQRVHGDYHLGQVLRSREGSWFVLDFEGEPARPLQERRRPASPVRDVAGMLRSFDYVAAQAVRDGAAQDLARAWADRARTAFLRGHGGGPEVQAWLPAFELEKLLYEIRYEAANRPDWLDIPLSALRRTSAADDQQQPDAGAPDTGSPVEDQIAALQEGTLRDPHGLLGFHEQDDGFVVRAWRPGADSVAYLPTPDGQPQVMAERVPGLFEAHVDAQPEVGRHRLRVGYPEGAGFDLVDPYSFPPTLGEVDQHLLGEGRHEQAWTVLGANRRTMHGIDGVGFAVWAPNARAVRVVGEFNSWDGRLHPMRMLGSTGIWEVFVPDVPEGARYKYELVTAEGALVSRADPWARWTEVPPGTASRVFTSSFTPSHAERTPSPAHGAPVSIYEVHLASWRRGADGEPLSYRDLGQQLAEYCTEMGFTHVEFLPVAEHPFGGSWGYQVTGHFAPTSRFGTPDDFRWLVDHLHGAGIGVIVDWVPAHFPKDEWALRRFDGTALYEHEDPRLGEHPDWGTMVFNFGRTEVRNFLLASALYWLEEVGVDGLRVDAVASMLYLDYSREEGQWIPNEYGGRENLQAVQLLQEVNATAYRRNPNTMMIAEESTAWPGVSRPTHLGGLGFGFKWNMGWMHDTLEYFAKDPVHRRWHHNQLTFGLVYAFSENFVLPLSHDEVVHGKGSLIGKMPGDEWQQFANLRALYGWMWGHPGKKLLFQGGEFGQRREWTEERSLDWHLVDESAEGEVNRHLGLQRLVAQMNQTYQALPALWRRDVDPQGFAWIDANNADDNLFSFLRHGEDGDDDVAVIANLSPTPQQVRIGLSQPGRWTEVLNTDAADFGGGNVGNMGGVDAEQTPAHGLPASAMIQCPPLGVIWLRGPGSAVA